MVIIKQKGPYLIVTADNSLNIYNSQSQEEKVTKLPDTILPANPSKGQEEILKNGARKITALCCSAENDFISLCTENRQMVVYDNKLNVIKNTVTPRGVHSIVFTPQNDVLFADKTGDAYLLRSSLDDSEPELILGHLSMLLDIQISECGKYVVTCDRDEKIRVSCYPNSYNIVSYCLGHTEFVTNVAIVENILISASGDGTIRFWNFLKGEQLHVINTNEFVDDKNIIEQFCKEMDCEKLEVVALPVIDMQVFSGNVTYIAVSLLNINGVQLYTLDNVDNKIRVAFFQKICLDVQLVAFSLGQKLYILTNENLLLYNLDCENGYHVEHSDGLSRFYESCRALLQSENVNNVSTLYKRKFDNLQEYLERKKIRLQSK